MHQNHFWNLLAKHLSGEASAEEKTELGALIKAHPELSYPAQHVTDLWKLKGGHDIRVAEKAFKKHLLVVGAEETIEPIVDYNINSEKRERQTNKFLPFFYVLTSLILLSGAWAIWKNQTNKTNAVISQTAEVSTRPGSRTKLTLPDGSVVWLNAGSKLIYSQPFGTADRTVTLTGEAFFDVVKMAKPFIIHTGGVQIKVLGTAFNVRSFPTEKKIETSLVRGRVEVTLDKSPEKKYVLKPNEKLTLNTEENYPILHAAKSPKPLATISNLRYIDSSTIAETSWVQNKLVFVDESFEEVARKMERWYNVTIDIEDDKLSGLRVGGGPFENETIQQALNALKIAFGFNYNIKGNKITITR